MFLKEIKDSMTIVHKMITICFAFAMIKHLQTENKNGVSEIVCYVCYLMISTLMISEFAMILKLCKNTITLLNGFNGIFAPMMMIFMGLSGNLVTASTLQNTIIVFVAAISNITVLFIIPLILLTTILEMASNISEIVDVSKIAKLIKKISIWLIEILMIVFISLLSLEGSLTINVDSTAVKATKSIVSNAVPVVGKLIRRCNR